VARLVQKYGGSSVADADSVKRVAARIVATRTAGHEVAVVVSAMGDTTDDLIDHAARVSPEPAARELDMLLTAGERISMAVLAMAIHDLGFEARSYTGSQAGLITDSVHGRARILDVTPIRIQAALDDGAIPIVAGFQGVARETKDITTLGRGGSDTTAVALAAALGADICEIYTDVDGVFSADPRLVPTAARVPRITYEEMLELAAHGAKVLHLRCVEYARRFGMPLHVRSSFSTRRGTIVADGDAEIDLSGGAFGPPPDDDGPYEQATHPTGGATVEQPIIAGVTHDLGDAKVTVVGVPDKPGEAAAIFEVIAAAEINIDMIVQNVSAAATGRTDVTFTCPMAVRADALAALEQARDVVQFEELRYDDQVAKVSLIGAGMRSHPGVSATFFRALADAGVNVEMISTSEIRISVVTRADDAAAAVRAVHSAFGLDVDGQAVVYAGTGR
jgi:aspartate kinase